MGIPLLGLRVLSLPVVPIVKSLSQLPVMVWASRVNSNHCSDGLMFLLLSVLFSSTQFLTCRASPIRSPYPPNIYSCAETKADASHQQSQTCKGAPAWRSHDIYVTLASFAVFVSLAFYTIKQEKDNHALFKWLIKKKMGLRNILVPQGQPENKNHKLGNLKTAEFIVLWRLRVNKEGIGRIIIPRKGLLSCLLF